MENLPAPSTPGQVDARLTSTLQAILVRTSDAMESVAVPLPIPEMIVRLRAQSPSSVSAADDAAEETFVEEWFRRARSSDSVLRFLAEPVEISTHTPRHCARCQELRPAYYVPKFSADDQPTSATLAYCETCYRVITRSSPPEDG
jgi:hypothetical protein